MFIYYAIKFDKVRLVRKLNTHKLWCSIGSIAYSIQGLSSISKMFDRLHIVMLGVACHKLTYSHMYAYLYTVLPLT